ALPGNVRFTSSLDEARATIRAEVRRGVDLMVFGGGDGTVVMGLTLLGEACRGHARREPAIGVLRLGSGNAIADTLGAGADVAEDLEGLARNGGVRRELPLLDVLGVRAPFVGVGIDAQVLENHALVGDLVFFVQAEDGIRDKLVTGVQTCALPISDWQLWLPPALTKRRFRYYTAGHLVS